MNKNQVKIAISPIGWTNDDMPELGNENTFERCISEMSTAGFSGCEVGSKFSRDPHLLKPALDERGLQVCNAWFSTFFAEGNREQTLRDFDEALDFLSEMGAKVIGCSEQSYSNQGKPVPMYGPRHVLTDEEWRRVIDGYNSMAERASQKNMSVCLHHHMCTGIETLNEIDRFMAGVGSNVFLLFDTGHIYASTFSQDAVVRVLKKYLPRIKHIHLKDCRLQNLRYAEVHGLSFMQGVRSGIFTVPGDGIIDFSPVFDLLEKHSYEGWLVVEAEQDPSVANPLVYAQKARQYIREMTSL